jgi:hypothetical protein
VDSIGWADLPSDLKRHAGPSHDTFQEETARRMTPAAQVSFSGAFYASTWAM